LKLSKGEDDVGVTSVNNHIGRQFWEFDPHGGTPEERSQIESMREEFARNKSNVKHSSDLLMRFQFASENRSETKTQVVVEAKHDDEVVVKTLKKALKFFSSLQGEDGSWAADYGGPLFLLPGLIIGLHVMGAKEAVFSIEHTREILRYLYNHQNGDGGWGLHIEGHSTMFCTALNYVSLRLLGERMDGGDGAMTKARKWILDHGSVTHVPTWGKFWLSVLGVYEWSGNNPLPPEMWLLPNFIPLHPGRMWCHTRMIYLPMSYLYGKHFVGTISSIVLSLRRELYKTLYHQVDWDLARNQCAMEDMYYPHPIIQDIIWGGLNKIVEPLLMQWPLSKLRKKALNIVMQHIHYEDENTKYICIGPVSKVLNMLCCWVEDPKSTVNKLHLSRVKDYLWIAEDGMKMQGYNGSQLWDAVFAVQAILATNLDKEYGSMLQKAHNFIKKSQIKENSSGNIQSWYRHITRGGWPFSTPDNGWPVSDCTAEALKTVLMLSQMPYDLVGEAIAPECLYDAVNLLLTLQNRNGGYSSYELMRSYPWLEVLNPAETFGDIMLDYQYVECTSAVVQGLTSFMKLYPNHQMEEIETCISKATTFIENMQLRDGYGSWGICYTYGTWFGIKGLVAAGKTYETSYCIRKACAFLLSKQLPSGGWGESYTSCTQKIYTNIPGNKSHITNTSWALLALIEAQQAKRDRRPLDVAAKVLTDHQMENGDFPQQEIIGVFNKNCMISYSSYRNIFPIWALGEYLNHVIGKKCTT
ncbi:hypothetical protein M8C21_019626, partial [Ambrosia artemisiifolia]